MTDFNDFLSPLVENEQCTVTPLAGDASSRRYYRVVSDQKSWVLMEWDPFDETKDFPFLSVQNYFHTHQVRVPKVHFYNSQTGLFLLEDLGDLTLERRFWEFQNQQPVLDFYKKALDELIKIHSLSFQNHPKEKCSAYQIEFSVEKLLWEMNYAKKYLLKEYLRIPINSSEEKQLEAEFTELCEELYQSPQVICHRDFHSRNVMLTLNDVAIIDFQDARLGPPAYDLVSLFYDSYVNLNQESVSELMSYYKNNFPHFQQLGLTDEKWDRLFLLQTIQRCFKACGSFASFKVTRDDDRYLNYIAPTLERVCSQLSSWKGDSHLHDLLIKHKNQWSMA